MKRPLLQGCALAIVAGALTGCADDETYADHVQACLDQTIRDNHRAWWAQGTWRIHGTGKRTHCEDPSLDTDKLELGSKPFRMRQGRYSLYLDDSTGQTDFRVDGEVGERCVRFFTYERVGSTVIDIDFPGEFVSSRSIRGEFSGIGPGSCKSEGTFDLTMELDPLPARPRDAGTDAPWDASADASTDASALIEAGDGAAIDDATTDAEGDVESPDSASTDAEAGAPDALLAQDATSSDGGDSGDSGESFDGGDAGADDDATSVPDDAGQGSSGSVTVSIDGSVVSADFEYAYWSGSASVDTSTGKTSGCSVAAGRNSLSASLGALWLGLLGLVAVRRRTRRS